MHKLKVCLALALGLAAFGASADTGYYKFVKIGGTATSPYITYNEYFCQYVVNQGERCTFVATVDGINPNL